MSPTRRGPARLLELFRLWRRDRRDGTARFTTAMAAIEVERIERRIGPLGGRVVVDLGAGRGVYSRTFDGRGATAVPVDLSRDHLVRSAEPLPRAVVADASRLPLRDGCADLVFSANLLEHVPAPAGVLDEIARVLAPGGSAYVTWTNWWSPWGGHAMTPYHLLGPALGPRLYERRHGPPATNRYGSSLFYTHIGRTLAAVRRHPGLELVLAQPRYWPSQRWILRVPGLRELLTWNCTLWLRRAAGQAGPSGSSTTAVTVAAKVSNGRATNPSA